MINQVTASELRCDFRDEVTEACASRVYTVALEQDQVRTLAAERAWGTEGDRDLCPKHRSGP